NEVVMLFFQRGAFDARAAEMTAAALLFYSLGLVGQAGEFILARGFFSLQDTRTPVKISAIAVVANLVLSLALLGPLQHGGLALANSIAALANMALLTFYLNRRVTGLWIPEMWRFTALVLLASGLMGGAIQAMDRWIGPPAPAGALGLALRVGLAVAAGTAIYIVTLTLFRFEETRRLRDMVKRALSRAQIGG
ncbi:MAG: polysaccharide biosynthesis C-terminal domain-containing protein, partial [Firmicutes bacterium]|nr:polysaccharide biosynthesis C-terminal domain-containing protein [Bacillota bacterium]